MSSDTPDAGSDQSMLPLGPDRPEGSPPEEPSAPSPETPTSTAPTSTVPGPDDPAREAHSADAPPLPEPPTSPNPGVPDEPEKPAPAATPSAPSASSGPRPRPRPASISDDMITVEDHLERILRGVGPLEAYDQPIVESLGLPLHENFVAPVDLPRFPNSSMDGYAVRAEDVMGATSAAPVTLPVVGEIVAGSAKPFAISAGTAVKIMTGAPIPRGADTVIPLERTDRGNARVSIQQDAPVGDNVRAQGSDVQAGDLVLTAGTVLGAREIGLLAALGSPRVKARPRPRVVVISTGSELREPGTHLD